MGEADHPGRGGDNTVPSPPPPESPPPLEAQSPLVESPPAKPPTTANPRIRRGGMRGVMDRPAGLAYRPDLIAPDEEAEVLAALDSIRYDQVEMRGQTARRSVRHFGYRYNYEPRQLTPAEPLPVSLIFIRDRCADLIGVASETLAEALVTRYPPGATIGWHQDAPMFGPTVVGVSLRTACLLRFQRTVADRRSVYELELAPRSAYVLSGSARAAWQHSVPPVSELRYSITFRTLRHPERWHYA